MLFYLNGSFSTCAGLAWAICEHIVDVIKAPTLFATHFHELTTLAHDNRGAGPSNKKSAGIANYHVSAHIDSSSRKLTMLYKVLLYHFACFMCYFYFSILNVWYPVKKVIFSLSICNFMKLWTHPIFKLV